MGEFFTSLGKVLGIGAGFASIPFFASLASLQPPWPPAIGFVSAALVLLGALVIWEWTRNTRVKNRRRAVLSAVAVTLFSLLTYLIFYSLFVENVPLSAERVIRGFTCTADAQLVYGAACPELPPEALEEAGWDNTVLWTRSSITKVRIALTVSWLGFTAGLMMAVGAVVAGRKF